MNAMYSIPGDFPGMIQEGNIDLAARPVVRMPDGSIATVRSVGVNLDGKEYLLPSVSKDGRLLSVKEAVDEFRKTGEFLGIFDSPEASTAYGQRLHEQQDSMYGKENTMETVNTNTETQEQNEPMSAPQEGGQPGAQPGAQPGTQPEGAPQEGAQTAPKEGGQQAGSIINQAMHTTGAPEVYDFSGSIPEGYTLDEGMSKAFGDICRKANLTNDQANELAKYGFQWNEQMRAMSDQARMQAMEQEKAATIKALGPNIEKTMQNIHRSMNYFEQKYPGFVEAVDKSGMGNNLVVCNVLSEIGSMISEDGGVGGTSHGKESNPYPNTDFSKY